MSGIIDTTGAKSGVIGITSQITAGASAFTATFAHASSWHTFAAGAIVTFNDASTGDLFNTGGDFNTSTYKYEVPATGLYHFGWNIYTSWNDLSNSFELIVDGDRPLSANSNRGYYSLANEASGQTDHFNNFDGIVSLTAGEDVWLEAHASSADFHANLSIFYGYQIT